MESSVIITPEDVLESLMNDGTIDAIRLKIINQLKANEELKNNTINMVEQSKVLNTPGAEKKTKRELFDALRQELEIPALERASKSVWELILDDGGLGKEINQTVERVFCRLSGQKPPLFPPSDNVLQQEKEVEENDNSGKDKESEHWDSSSKKRNFNKMSVEIEEGEVAEEFGNPPSIPDNSGGCGKNAVSESRRCKRTDGRSWRCTKERAPSEKYCEKHIYHRKKPKKQVEGRNQGTSSNNMVESSPKISSSTPSKFVPDDNDNNHSSHRNGKPSPRLASSPKVDLKDDTCERESSLWS
ncbi:Antigenic heat-stable protein [Thalictrum thalictroides]|uniref:Antigenic heat-stable protein n=1 Tax=Thalictrum thalictroides TaxID=46969 RepID=A0A7J6X6L1_THATH|nr:Antigenic heat-stable protein [Thalictrum thalictroides]